MALLSVQNPFNNKILELVCFLGNPDIEPNVTMLYRASDVYGISELSASLMYSVTER